VKPRSNRRCSRSDGTRKRTAFRHAKRGAATLRTGKKSGARSAVSRSETPESPECSGDSFRPRKTSGARRAVLSKTKRLTPRNGALCAGGTRLAQSRMRPGRFGVKPLLTREVLYRNHAGRKAESAKQ